jgi:hypothetical protein
MSIFTILTYAMLTMVVVTGVASLPRELGLRRGRRGLERPVLPAQTRRVLRHRA